MNQEHSISPPVAPRVHSDSYGTDSWTRTRIKCVGFTGGCFDFLNRCQASNGQDPIRTGGLPPISLGNGSRSGYQKLRKWLRQNSSQAQMAK